MNRVKYWEIIYKGTGQIRIEKMLNVLFEAEDWEELHRAQWVWLSLDSQRLEAEWFEAFNVPEVTNYCFACETAELAWKRCPTPEEEDEDCPPYCHCCPLTASAELDECLGGLCDKWLETEEREVVAMEIANLEWRKEVK